MNVNFHCDDFINTKKSQDDPTTCCFNIDCNDIQKYKKAEGSPIDLDFHESSCYFKGQYICKKRFLQFMNGEVWDRLFCRFVQSYRIPDNLEYPDYYAISLDTFRCIGSSLHHNPDYVSIGTISDQEWNLIQLP